MQFAHPSFRRRWPCGEWLPWRSGVARRAVPVGVAACGVELVQVLARHQDIPLQAISAAIDDQLAGERAANLAVGLFSLVRLQFTLRGITAEQSAQTFI